MIRFVGVLLFVAVAFGADWNPELAARYLDSRQQAWFAWPRAKAVGGTCFSCHTGATYLLARPALRWALGESEPVSYETALRNALVARVQYRDAKDGPLGAQALGVEAVFAALFLAPGNDGQPLNADVQAAFDRLWALQIQDGPAKGAWSWFQLGRDPYEMPDSVYYGATLAALASGRTPPSYRGEPQVRTHIQELSEYLARGRESQPLHNRLMALWASTALPDVLAPAARRSTIAEVWDKQSSDGGWTIQSLGPWKEHPKAPASTGTNSYATGLAAFVLSAAGVPRSDSRLARAVNWLASHQDRQTGSWAADSMNKEYPPGSMEKGFMRDAATAFASMALAQTAEKNGAGNH
ncbi:MAG: hypothetical protein ACRD9L_09955, partial [Bryobacteraceae bacterium]